jgi:hypothetical protein
MSTLSLGPEDDCNVPSGVIKYKFFVFILLFIF